MMRRISDSTGLLLCLWLIGGLLLIRLSGCRPAKEVVSSVDYSALHLRYAEALTDLNAAANLLADTTADKIILTERLRAARTAFKRMEFALEYIDPEAYRSFNGAPVLSENRSGPSIEAVLPEGFQALEAVVCGGAPDDSSIPERVSGLLFQIREWSDRWNSIRLSEGEWFDAMRMHLIRLEALNLAGFDQVCVDRRYAEMVTALKEMAGYADALLPAGHEETRLLNAFDAVISPLKAASDEAAFDPAAFIRGPLTQLRRSLADCPTAYRSNVPYAVNLASASLYDPGFLNAGFFSDQGLERPGLDALRTELGRRLFFETALSVDGQMSCATCHQPDRAFTDGRKISRGAGTAPSSRRNTPDLRYTAFQGAYMYDGRAASLEEQVLHVFRNEKEFNLYIADALDRLTEQPAYSTMFTAAYPEMGTDAVRLAALTHSLAAFIRSLPAFSSPFDRYMRGETGIMDTSALSGFRLFLGKAACGKCHFPPLFSGLAPPQYTDSELEHLGVPIFDPQGRPMSDPDAGRYYYYSAPAFRGFFKTPSLRNAAETAPYMHNGVLPTLDSVLVFYNIGGGAGLGLIQDRQTLPAEPLNLSTAERGEIESFLRALSDEL